MAVTLAYGVYVVWRVRAAGWDPSFFIIAGPLAADPTATLPNVRVFPPGTTYDGQFYYRLALEPWTDAWTAYGITLDEAAYRQQRILYPLLAWVISAGRWQVTPLALIVANLLAVGVLAYAAAAYAMSVGRSVFASLMVAFYPGYLVSISRDLAEITEAALLVTGLVLIERRRNVLAGAALTAGMLARETLLVVPMAGVVVWAIGRLRNHVDRGPPLAVWLAPLVAYGVWFAAMVVRWGPNGLDHGGYINFGAPLEGLAQHLATIDLRQTALWDTDLVELALVALPVCAVVITYRPRPIAADVLPLACVISALAGLSFSIYVWRDAYAYLRAFHELFLCAALALLGTSRWLPRILAPASIMVWCLFAVQHGGKP